MTKEPLLDAAYRMLDESKLKYREIAAGAGVDFNWLVKFKQRDIKEPGVSKVQAVYDFLRSGKRRIPSDDHAA